MHLTFDVVFSGDTHLLKRFSTGDEGAEMNYRDLKKQFPDLELTLGEVCELARDGFVAVAVGHDKPRRVFTLRIEAAEGAREFPFPARRA